MEGNHALPVGKTLAPLNNGNVADQNAASNNPPIAEVTKPDTSKGKESKPDTEKLTLKSMIIEFLDDTTTHGVPHAADENWALGANPTPRRLFWFITWLAAIASLINFSILRWQYFASYPFNTVITLQSEQSLPFPAVTICPLNVVSKSKTENFSSAKQIVYDDVVSYGHEVEDFLIKCEFNLKKCSKLKEWDTIIDKDFGNCFSYNTSAIESDYKRVTEPNKDNGLTLRLAINADKYQTFSEELGFVVKVHDPIIKPDMADAIKIPSGFAAEVKIRQEKVDRLPWPFHSEDPCRPTDGFESYNRAKCEHACTNSHIQSECGCGLGISQSVTRQCQTEQEFACANRIAFPGDGIVRGSDGVACSLRCPSPCSETKYNMQLSLSDYPAKFDTRVLQKANVNCMKTKQEKVVSTFPGFCQKESDKNKNKSPQTRRLQDLHQPQPKPSVPMNVDDPPPPPPPGSTMDPVDPYYTGPYSMGGTNGPSGTFSPDPSDPYSSGTSDPYSTGDSYSDSDTCSPGCYDSWINDDYCDDACNVPECNFDGQDCGGASDWDDFGVDVDDPGKLGDAAREELLALVGDGWSPPPSCQNITKQEVVLAYLEADEKMETMHHDLKEVGGLIMTKDNLADIILSMTSTNTSTIGDWIAHDCGVPPNTNQTVNWDLPPSDSFVTESWATEKSEYALLRVYFSEFNVEHIEESEAYGYISMLAELGGTYGLAAGISVMTMFEFVEFILVVLYFFLKCGRARKAVYKVSPET